MLKKVISGFQIGADIAGIKAAKALGLETGGWMPKGFKTLIGNIPAYAAYGARETKSEEYPTRTYANVADSDGTIRLATSFESRGEKCTLKAIKEYKKPYLDVNLNNINETWDYSVANAAYWIIINNIKILNISGNAKQEIEPTVFRFLKAVFALVKEEESGIIS